MHSRRFTMIELLVVVVIIGILAGIIIPVFLSTREKARKMFKDQKGRKALALASRRVGNAEDKMAAADSEEDVYGFRPAPGRSCVIPKTEKADIEIKLSASSFASNFKVYTVFDVTFKGKFTFRNDAPKMDTILLYFPFPESTAQASEVSLKIKDASGEFVEPEGVQYSLYGIQHLQKVDRTAPLEVEVTYNAQGYNRYVYQGPGANKAGSLNIEMTLEGLSSEFIPLDALQPTKKESGHLSWQFSNLITNRRIIVELPGEKSPIGRVILLLRLTGIAVLLFGLGFMYMNDLEDPKRLLSFRWGHFLLLALIYSLFFVIFAALNLGGGMNAAIAIALSMILSLPLLMIHVGRFLGAQFALRRILPLAIFSLCIVLVGVYGGAYIIYLYIALTVIAMSFFTLTYKQWSEQRRDYGEMRLQKETQEWQQIMDANEQKRNEEELTKLRTTLIDTLNGLVRTVSNLHKDASISEYKAQLLLDDEEQELENSYRARTRKCLDHIAELKATFQELQDGVSRLRNDILSGDFTQSHSRLEGSLQQNALMLNQTLEALDDSLDALKRFREHQKMAEDRKSETIHCLACGDEHLPSKYCPNCGILNPAKLECAKCGHHYVLPVHLLDRALEMPELHCHFCGASHDLTPFLSLEAQNTASHHKEAGEDDSPAQEGAAPISQTPGP